MVTHRHHEGERRGERDREDERVWVQSDVEGELRGQIVLPPGFRQELQRFLSDSATTLEITGMEPRRRSLEEFFLEIIKKGNA